MIGCSQNSTTPYVFGGNMRYVFVLDVSDDWKLEDDAAAVEGVEAGLATMDGVNDATFYGKPSQVGGNLGPDHS